MRDEGLLESPGPSAPVDVFVFYGQCILFAGLDNIRESLTALVGDILPVLSGHTVFREEF